MNSNECDSTSVDTGPLFTSTPRGDDNNYSLAHDLADPPSYIFPSSPHDHVDDDVLTITNDYTNLEWTAAFETRIEKEVPSAFINHRNLKINFA